MNKKLKLGIVGPKDFNDRILKQLAPYQNEIVEPVIFEIQLYEDTRRLTQALKSSCDLILFSGHINYQVFLDTERETPDHELPMLEYARFDGSALYRAFFELAMENKGSLEPIFPFSIDSLDKNMVYPMLQEIEVDRNNAVFIEGQLTFSTDEWADAHEEAYRNGHTRYAITCLTSVYEQLMKRQIPVKRITSTYESINSALELAVSKAETRLHQQLQTNVIIISWAPADRRPKNRYTNYRKLLTIQENILNFCEKWKVSINFSGEKHAIIFTNRETAATFTNQFKSFPLVTDLHTKSGNIIFAGIGLGNDTAIAELNAEKALQFAEMKQKSCTYVVFMEGNVSGPLLENEDKPLVFSTVSDNPEVSRISKEASVSVITITRLQSLMKELGSNDITTYHVAKSFDISLRSARRLLQQLEKHNFAQVIGEEQPPGRGRPRQVFRLKIPIT